MANYTIELRQLLDNGFKLFDFNYPFYDESERPKFEEKFIRHFYFREIGQETPDRFKWYLQDKFNMIMPYYNELFKTALVEYDIKYNYDVTETETRRLDKEDERKNINSSVSTFEGENDTQGNGSFNQDTKGNVKGTNTDTQNENYTFNNDMSIDRTLTADTDKTGAETTTENGTDKSNRKFLDTPQGAVDLTDTKYLTSLNDDTNNHNKSIEETDNENINTTETEKTTHEETHTMNKSATNTGDTETDTTENTSSENEYNSNSKDTQKSTFDNNIIDKGAGTETETTTRKMFGNIGVQTASDIISKHVELQRVIRRLEEMFFDECEDLFMLLY